MNNMRFIESRAFSPTFFYFCGVENNKKGRMVSNMLINAISPIKRLKGEEGQDIVEFALVTPILFAILFGIIDFSWIFYNTSLVTNSAREGARFAVMHYKEADSSKPAGGTAEDYLEGQVKANVEDALPGYLKNSSANLSVSVTKQHVTTDNDRLVVTVNSDIRLFTPIVSTIRHSSTYRITRSVSMKKLAD